MRLRNSLKVAAVGVSLPFLLLADISPEAPFGLMLGREATAIVGRPATPVSVAGVARRSTVRVATTSAVAVSTTAAASSAAASSAAAQQQAVAQQQAATAQQQAAVAQQQAAVAQQQAQAAGVVPVGTVAADLPTGCVAAPKGGVEYYQCGPNYFRAAFQGNNLVYVSVAKP
jgi:hypothetical protein